MNIVGRKEEMKELQRIYDSGSSEFVVVYGRRRVGKTYLIREFFHDDFVFYATGVARGNRTEQLAQFNSSLARYGDSEDQTAPENWFLAFGRLEKLVAKSRKQRKVIFWTNCRGWTRRNRILSRLWKCFGMCGLRHVTTLS